MQCAHYSAFTQNGIPINRDFHKQRLKFGENAIRGIPSLRKKTTL